MVVPVTGGWQSWQTVTAVAELPAGEHILRFANGVASAPQYNVNRFEFTLLDKADIDRNGTVNLADYSLLGACFAGPDILVAPGGCTTTNFTRSDLDEDGDVDLADFGVFQIQP
jgi:putative intracellular protease/amidase